jgi:hypothetical protein
LVPVALLPPARRTGLLLDAFLGLAAFRVEFLDVASVAPLFEDGVALPAEVTDPQGAVGKGGDELALEVRVKAVRRRSEARRRRVMGAEGGKQ